MDNSEVSAENSAPPIETTASRMSIAHETKRTLVLAFPIIIGQLSQMLLGMADTVMVGHLGVTDLAALTFANALFSIPFIGGIGILSGISVRTANAKGGGDDAGAKASCRNGLFVALALGILLFAAGWLVSMNLERLGQPPDVAARTVWYFRIIMASIIPGFAWIAVKNHADALDRPWPPFWFAIGGSCVDIVLNFALIYGLWGFPAYGLEGAALSTLIGRFVIFAATFAWLLKADGLKAWIPVRWLRPPDPATIRRLLAIGFPSSLSVLCEVGAFSAAGLAMGHFGEASLAAHQIALTCAGTGFMIPLGLSMALSIRIGQVDGAGEYNRLKPVILSGWLLGGIFAITAVLIYSLFGRQIAWLFIREQGVISLTASLFVIVGFFQISDSLQVVSAGMLRGLRDVKISAVMGFVSYWLVGLPLGLLLAVACGMEARGVWWGLAAGLTMAALTLGPRLWIRKGQMEESSAGSSSP